MRNTRQPITESMCLDIGNYIVATNCTVRSAAKHFALGKTTIHNQMTRNLPQINFGLSCSVKTVLAKNKAERHLRGGEVTKTRYKGTAKKAPV